MRKRLILKNLGVYWNRKALPVEISHEMFAQQIMSGMIHRGNE
jgi:hypothetical protein